MDGLTAARTLRAIEAQHKTSTTPIVFFSSMKADEALKAQMDMLTPASYVNKGWTPTPRSSPNEWNSSSDTSWRSIRSKPLLPCDPYQSSSSE